MKTNKYFFSIKSRSVLLRLRNGSDNNRRENQDKRFAFDNFLFGNVAIYEIMWKNIEERGRPHDNMAHAHSMLDK